MHTSGKWFTETCDECGSAFSLSLKDMLHQEHSEFQHIAIYETTHFGTLMVIDGLIMLSDRDNFIYHEMMSHVPIMSHVNPQDVAIIGGGDCGTLKEVLKHQNIAQVIQIDIDERVTRLSEQYFPQLCESNNDSRANLVFTDGIKWMAEAKSASLDVIIVDSTDPVGPAVGLFHSPFYRDCYRVLRSGGIIIQQSGSPLVHSNLIKSIHDVAVEVGFSAVQITHFPQCSYPTGWWSATLACKQVVSKPTVREIQNIQTEYYNAKLHRSSMALPNFLQNIL